MNINPVLCLKNQNPQRQTFKGYKGINGYGRPEDLRALLQKVQIITPMPLNTSQDPVALQRTLQVHFQALKDNTVVVSRAIAGLTGIGNDYGRTSVARYTEIKKMVPKGSRIWIVGVVPQTLSVLTGSFKEKIARCCAELTDDIDDLIKARIFGDLERIINGYNESHDAFLTSLKHIHDRRVKTAIRASLDAAGKQLNTNTAFVCSLFSRHRDMSYQNALVVKAEQTKNQVFRTGAKCASNALGGGLLSALGLDDVIADAGIPVVSDLIGSDLVGHAIHGVSNKVIASISDVTLGHVDLGNIAMGMSSRLGIKA